jgi:subtilase family serine protease
MNMSIKIRLNAAAILLMAAFDAAAQSGDILRGDSHPPLRRIVTPAGSLSQPPGIYPAQMRAAYGIDQLKNGGARQTVAVVDAYDDPQAEADLAVFSTQFHLPACTTANGCFRKLKQSGTPPDTTGWTNEIALDTQWVHALAPLARILLVEARSGNNADLFAAVDLAVKNGATVVSMSWVANEAPNELQADAHFQAQGVTFVASSGDFGHGAFYPAASPFVVGVGGTTLTIRKATGAWEAEIAWNESGGGVSRYEPEPTYQAAVQATGERGVPDVSFDGDPFSGVPVYNSYACGLCTTGWGEWGGTSLGSPCWAAIFSIVNTERANAGKSNLGQPHLLLYAAAETDYHDIVAGSNGSCGALCNASPGYDFVTGVGSPQANLLVPALVAAP